MKLKKITGFALSSVLSLAVVSSLVFAPGCGGVGNKPEEGPSATPVVTDIFSKEYYIPGKSDRNWCEGMVSGNGENGVITSGAPYADTFIFQNMSFNMPNDQYRDIVSEMPDELQATRDAVMENDSSWNFSGRTRQFYYNFHPGHMLKVTSEEDDIEDYSRWTDFTTAEVGVTYTDSYGEWERKTFTSREDNVTITAIESSSEGAKVNLILSIENLSDIRGFGTSQSNGYEKNVQYKKLVDDNLNYIAEVVHYPTSENILKTEYARAGFAGVTQVVVVGGTKNKVSLGGVSESQNVGEANPAIEISDADKVYLVTKCDRTFDMGEFSQFAGTKFYDLVDNLYDDTDAVVKKYDANGDFDYQKALEAHVKLHKPEFSSVTLDLHASEADRALSTEELIRKQRESDTLIPAFVERAYYNGRYAQICASGYSTPRLGGLWTGEWNSPWGGMYTMDANVNLQVAAMNTGNLTYSPIGYISFILRQVGDWMTNAEKIYGMHDAIQAPHNTDGDCGLMIQSDANYPFQYWNSGASWLLLPIFEYWQCYGNQQIPIPDGVDLYEIKRVLGVRDGGLTDSEVKSIADRGYLDLERDILLPLLTKQSNFWEQLCTPEYYVDGDGNPHYTPGKTSLSATERYLIIPSYSPENKPNGSYNQPVTMNSTMDIAAAKSGLEMTIDLEAAVNGTKGNTQIERWQDLKSLLPDYQLDGEAESDITSTGGGGALKEWSVNRYIENNTHRHLSHLYVAWPSYETQYDSELYRAAKQALANRRRLNTGDDTTGHGWIHQTLIAARLGEPDVVYENMKLVMSSQIYFTSMMTDHNTNRKSNTYCTDTALGMLGAINESLIYSNTGEIRILPSLIEEWESGEITGIRARTQVEINSLRWDTVNKNLSVTLTSDINQTIALSSGLDYGNVTVTGCSYTQNGDKIELSVKAGERVTVTYGNEEQTAAAALKKMIAEGYLPATKEN